MNYLNGFKISLTNLSANKMRSFLTMLGIIVGVMSIILLISVVAGTRAQIEGEMKSMGSNTFIVLPGNVEETHGPPDISVKKLKLRHVELIEQRSSFKVKASPVLILMGQTVKYKRESRDTTLILGTTPNFTYTRNWNISLGNFFKKEELEIKRKVCVVGETLVRDLFRNINPIGKELTIADKKLRVIGVLEKKGRFFGQNMDDCVVIPITTAQELLGINIITRILVKTQEIHQVDKAIAETKRILAKEMDKEDFSVKSQGELLGMFNTFANVLSVVMGCVASIALFVGGIGIMNIMLVTVRERTREIGLRKAVGASFNDILLQFLIEALFFAITGGLLGIILSMLIIHIASFFIPFPLKASITSIVIAFVFSSLTGIFFGTYPAIKAAKVDPIVALKYE